MSRFLLFLATRAGGVASFQVCESLEGIRLLRKKQKNKNQKKKTVIKNLHKNYDADINLISIRIFSII